MTVSPPGAQFAGLGRHETQRALDPLHLRRVPGIDVNQLWQEADEMMRGWVIEADHTADHRRRRTASSMSEDLVAIADVLTW